MVVASNASGSQWLFSLQSLERTPTSLGRSLLDDLYDRSRGVEFLFRLGSTLNMHLPALFTAATWFHRFYMRYSMEDFHRQVVAAACIFLASKTEECGRKLRDVARVVCAKSKQPSLNFEEIPADSREVEEIGQGILTAEEVLLDALCFDFIVDSPHFDLVSLFEMHQLPDSLHDHAFSIANDTYRTPLCILYTPKIIAATCYVLAQRLYDGSNSPSLDARLAPIQPSASLPTPPAHKSASPDVNQAILAFFALNELEVQSVIDSLSILLEFYRHVDAQGLQEHLGDLLAIAPPSNISQRSTFYKAEKYSSRTAPSRLAGIGPGHATPESLQGNRTPIDASSQRSTADSGAIVSESGSPRLDLS
ncbi:unnamed protein product [Peniophora sp. CBMAI 1063]|nr:unnamed protein product [Peniophora sp. CBMAI 1063]